MQADVPHTLRLGVAQAVDELDLGVLGRAVWRKKRSIIALTLAAASLAFIAVKLITPLYKSEARVLIETRDNIFLRPEAEKTVERAAVVDQEAVTSQVQLILSRDLAREVIKKLRLGERPEFDPVLRSLSSIKVFLMHLGIIKDPMSQSPEERVLKNYLDRLVAYSVDKSRVIAIEFESEDPELAAQAANAIAESYLVLQQAAKQEQSRAASQWLSGEIEGLRKKVADAESRVEQYRANTNLFVGTNNTTLSNQQLGDLNAQLSAARAQKADAEAKARIIRDSLRSGPAIEFSDIANSELIRRLSEQRVILQAQLAEQSSTLLGQHPRIKELRAQIADLDRQLRIEAERLARSLENDAKLAEARVASLSTSLEQLKRLAANTNEQDVELRALEREAKSQRDLLESYLAKYREAAARDNLGAASPEARIISRALVSTTPAYPKVLATILVVALGTFVVSMGWVLTGELLGVMAAAPLPTPVRVERIAARPQRIDDTAVRQPIEATDVMAADAGVDEAAPLAAAEGGPPQTLASAPAVPYDAIEHLASELGAAGGQGSRVVILGTDHQSQTARAAIVLARSLAEKRRVVLIDLTSGSGGVSAVASDRNAPGLGELVAGSASFGEIITRDRYSAAHVIMAGTATVEGAEVLNSRRFSIAVEALARSYDHLVMNAGTIDELPIERLAHISPRAGLIGNEPDDPLADSAQKRLYASGFAKVTVLASIPPGPEAISRARAAA